MTPGTPTVLGLCSGTHDSAAALITEGELVGLVEEERLNEEKHTSAYPERAVSWLLDHAGLSATDVTSVAYNFNPALYKRGVLSSLPHLASPATRGRALARARSFRTVQHRSRDRLADIAQRFPQAHVRGVDHHRAHGLYAFATAGYEEAAVLIVDSLGEVTTTSIAHARLTEDSVRYRTMRRLADPASLGYAYGAVTEHLGWRRGDEEGTVMALAALGNPARFRTLFANAIVLTDDGFALDPRFFPLRVISSRYPRLTPEFVRATCPPRSSDAAIGDVHADVAAALQERTEQAMVHLACRARALTGARLLCVVGGVAMNCLSIGRIVERADFDEVAVPSAPGDAGTAAGAALAMHHDEAGTMASGAAHRCYLGPGFKGFHLPERPRGRLRARRLIRPVQHVARELADGRIVGCSKGVWRLARERSAIDRSLPHLSFLMWWSG